jgi:hypothetical protein
VNPGLIGQVAGAASCEAADMVLSGQAQLGQIENIIAGTMSKFFDKFGPQIASQFAAVAEPAARKSAELIGPVVEQKLKEYGPTFAMIMGGVLGAFFLAGIFGARRIKQVRRNPWRGAA